jgi:hypothetical protein
VKYPKRLRHRGKGKVLATIYKRPDFYRLYWRARVDGKPRSQFQDFPTYSEAKRKGDKVVADLVKGSQAAVLSPGQARDALSALERLQSFYVFTGRRVSLLAAVSEYAEAAGKLHGRTLGEAVEGYPLMRRDEGLDPAKLKQAGGRPKRYTVGKIVSILKGQRLESGNWFKIASSKTGIGRTSFYDLLEDAKRDPKLKQTPTGQWFYACLSGCVPKAENLGASPAINKGKMRMQIPCLATNRIGMVL